MRFNDDGEPVKEEKQERAIRPARRLVDIPQDEFEGSYVDLRESLKDIKFDVPAS